MTDSWIPKRSVLFALLIVVSCLFLFTSCTCGDGSSGDNGADDDDLTVDDDDDSFVDDDLDDDSSTTTTTTSSTTSTTTSSSTTSTTHVTTTSTTTTTIGPPGTSCNPLVESVEKTIAPRYGPWPAFELNGVTIQQFSGVVDHDLGPSDVLMTSDGVAHLAIREGISLDHVMIDENGAITREVIHPLGGERKILAKDLQDHLYLAYTYYPGNSERVNELRFATNKSGEWEVTTLLAIDGESPDLDMTVDENGVAHLIYNEIAFRDTSVYYATWDGETFTQTLLEGDDVGWRVGCYVALDAAGTPHLIYGDSNGLWYLTPDGVGGWNRELLALGMAAWDMLIDENDRPRIAATTNADGHLFQIVRGDDAWNFEPIDECRTALYVNMLRDAAGHTHFVYTDSHADEMLLVTDESGEWVFTKIFDLYSDDAWDIAADIDANGTLHVVHYRRLNYGWDKLYYTKNEASEWKSLTLVGGDGRPSTNVIRDAQGRLHSIIVRDHSISYGIITQEGWTESVIEYSGTESGIERFELRLDSLGVAHVVYANEETLKLLHAVQAGSGWDIEEIRAGQNYLGLFMAIGSDDVIHTAYSTFSGGSGTWFTTNESGVWTHEMIDPTSDPNQCSDFLLGAGDQPISAYAGVNTTGMKVAKRDGFEDWAVEDANPFVEITPAPLAQAPDGSLRLFTCTNGECWLSSDETGNWLTESVPYGHQYDKMVVDSSGAEHILSYANNEPLGLKGIIHQAQIHDEWTWEPIFLETGGGTVSAFSILPDEKLFGTFYSGGASLAAEFSIEIDN